MVQLRSTLGGDGEPGFRWRGGEVSRVEGLSDAVFAIALGILVLALPVPQTYAQLMVTVRQFPAFAACFTLIVMCWIYHYKFFRRYGLQDGVTLLLNTLFLFCILFYVYPAMFLAKLLINPLLGFGWNRVVGPEGTTGVAIMVPGHSEALMVFYSAGFTTLFALLLLMNLHAYRLREAFELDSIELRLARGTLTAHGITVSVGVASILLELATAGPWSGWVYFLLGPLHFAHGWWNGTAVQRMLSARAAQG